MSRLIIIAWYYCWAIVVLLAATFSINVLTFILVAIMGISEDAFSRHFLVGIATFVGGIIHMGGVAMLEDDVKRIRRNQ